MLLGKNVLKETRSHYGRCGTLSPSSGMRTWSILPDQMMADGAGCLLLATVTAFRTPIHVVQNSQTNGGVTCSLWGVGMR